MNIKNIKNRAEELLLTSKPQIIRICTIMMLVGLLPSLFSNSNNFLMTLINYVLTILFLCFGHGYIVSSLKVVRNNAQSLSDDDAFVGLTRFKDLFSTYFISGLIMFVAMFFVIFVLMFLFIGLFGAAFSGVSSIVFNSLVSQNDPYALLGYMMTAVPSLFLVVLLMSLLIIVCMFVVETMTFAMPYLLEQYHMSGGVALKESVSFIKGHILDYIKLELSFVGWVILIVFIQSILTNLLAFIPVLGHLIAIAIAGLASIYLYYPKYILSRAIFFEEIAYYRYENIYQQGDMNHE